MTRETTKSLIIVGLLIVILVGGAIITHKRGGLPHQQIPQVTEAPVLTEQSVQEETDLYVIDVKYPEYSGVSAEFNAKIKQAAIGYIDEFKAAATADRQARLDTASTPAERTDIINNPWKYGYGVGYTPVQTNEQYVSLLMHQNGFEGGAHGYDVIHTFNYDVPNQKELTLADMFPNDSNYLQTLSTTSREQLKAKLGEWYSEEMLIEGTTPTLENFSEFTFTNPDLNSGQSMITIYFQQYQVGPYAIGQQTVEIPKP